MNKSSPFHTIEDMGFGVYRIEEAGVNCYLVVGDEKALLIDTCSGLGNIRSVAESITPLPIEAVVTHAHTDHISGATWFEKVYVHKADISFTATITSFRFVGKKLLLSNPKSKEKGISKKDFLKKKFKPAKIAMQDGHSFDLGNRTVKVVHTPGHTKGSIVLLDEKSKFMFTGDNTSPALWMFVPGAVSLEAWLPGALKTYELANSYTSLTGHMPKPQSKEQIAALIEQVKTIIAQQPKNRFFSKMKIYPSKDEIMKENAVTVWYRPGNVHGK